jgi:hypothetical protein
MLYQEKSGNLMHCTLAFADNVVNVSLRLAVSVSAGRDKKVKKVIKFIKVKKGNYIK